MKIDLLHKRKKSEYTRMCIAEAIIQLLERDGLTKIRISDIVTRAGVSRMTFYNNYSTINDAMEDCINIILGRYLEECTKLEPMSFRSYERLLHAIKFYDEYRAYFIALKNNGMYSVMLNAINTFMEDNWPQETLQSSFAMYCYSGGLLNAFLKWEESPNKCAPEEVAKSISILFSFNNPIFLKKT